jgi:hypothetical protein
VSNRLTARTTKQAFALGVLDQSASTNERPAERLEKSSRYSSSSSKGKLGLVRSFYQYVCRCIAAGATYGSSFETTRNKRRHPATSVVVCQRDVCYWWDHDDRRDNVFLASMALTASTGPLLRPHATCRCRYHCFSGRLVLDL